MTQAFYILLALIVGLGSAVQVSMLGSLGRFRGPIEATWISMLASVVSATVFLAARSSLNDPPKLAEPFSHAYVFAPIAALAGLALAISIKGSHPYFAISGIFGFAYVISAGYLAPRTGIALFVAAVTAGTLIGSVALDHFGAFGNTEQRITLARTAGVLALIVGVVLVRSGR
jgi:transporter family-2 protein